MIYILKGFQRTEYEVLHVYADCEGITIDSLSPGTLVIPGFILRKLSGDQMASLNRWMGSIHNHLILLPSWIEMNVGELFDFSVPVNVRKSERLFYEEIPVEYILETPVKQKLFESHSQCLGISTRKDTGSGLLTVTTLPLLDYRLKSHEEKLKNILLSLIDLNKNTSKNKHAAGEENRAFEPDKIHLDIFILAAAGIPINRQLHRQVKKYFMLDVDHDTLKQHLADLEEHAYIKEGRMSEKGELLIQSRRLKPFIKVLKEREEKSDGWE